MVLNYSNNQAGICFIDTNVPDYEVLLKGVHPAVEVILLTPDQDGLHQITEALATRPDISTIHIVAHGSPGTLHLGNTELSLTTLDRYTQDLKAWFNPKSQIQNPKSHPAGFHPKSKIPNPKSQILLYACNVAAGDAGEEFITKLHQVTGANIAASTTRIGSAALGGNWNLDYCAGRPSGAIAFTQSVQRTYAGILSITLDLDANDDSGITGIDSRASFGAGGTPVAIAIDPAITDNDDTITDATITLTNPQAGDILSGVDIPTGTGITASADGTTVTLSGTGTVAEYQAAIAAITFDNPNANLDPRNRTVEVTVNDATTTSKTATTFIIVDADTDGDGISNPVDLDDDNDGILDVDERGKVAVIDSIDFATGTDISTFNVTYTPAAGNNRAVILVLASENTIPNPRNAQNATIQDATVTLGGVQMTQVALDYGIYDPTKNDTNFLAAYLLTEEQLQTVSGNTLTINTVNVAQEFNGYLATLENFEQRLSTALFDVEPTETNNVSWSSPPVTAENSDVLLYFTNSGSSGATYDFDQGTEIVETGGSGSSLGGSLVEIDADGTYTLTGTTSTTRRSSGIVLRLKSITDTDGDGIANHLDLDSDNDGISDLVESGQDAAIVDTNNDGILDSTTDADSDGLQATADADDSDVASGGTVIPADSETTPDSIPDYLDLDSDNDGIPDTVEARSTAGYTANDGDITDNDADGDGVIDLFDANDGTTGDFGGTFATPVNTDGTDNPDYIDNDSDNDGNNDAVESGLTPGADSNGDGIGDGVGASYADPDGNVDAPLTNLDNTDLAPSDADYRSLDAAPPFIDLNATTNLTFSNVENATPGEGGTARYTNVGMTTTGAAIDMLATIVSIANPDPGEGTNPDRTVVFSVDGTNDFKIDVPGQAGNRVEVLVEYQFVLAGTDTPVNVPEFKFTIKDFDDLTSNSNNRRIESVIASGISSYAVNDPTEVAISQPTADTYEFQGTTVNDETDKDAAAELIYNTTSTFRLTYVSDFQDTSKAGFVHDGDGEFTLDSPQITVLDETINDYSTTFTEDGPAVNVADATAADVNDFTENDVTSLRIVADPTRVIDGGAEIVTIGGTDFPLDTNAGTPVQITVGTTTIDITYDSTTGTFDLVENGGDGILAQEDLDTLLRGITYRNTSDNPTVGDRTLVFTATDSSGSTSTPTAVSTIAVVPVNDPPVLDLDGDDSTAADADYRTVFTEGGGGVAIADSDTTITDADNSTLTGATITLTNAQVGDVLSGASIPGGSGISVDPSSTNSQIVLTGTGTIDEYEAAIAAITFNNLQANPNIADRTIEVVVNDGTIDSNIATTTITVAVPPVAQDDSPVASVGNPITFDPLTNDSDSDGSLDPTTVQLIDPDTGNPLTSLTVPGEGTWSVDPTSGDITFTPDAGFTDDPTPVSYTVADNDGNTSNPATITIDYQEGPAAQDDSPVASVGNPITFDPLTNDSDSDGSLDPTSVQLIDPDTGNPVPSHTVAAEGTWSVDPTSGHITFTPDAGFTDDPTTVSYTVEEKDGNTSNPAPITIDYQEGPAAQDDSPVASVGNPITFDPLTNDSDSDGSLDPTTVQLIDPDTGNPLTSLTVPSEGTWSVDPTSGEITFTPDAGFTDDPTPVTYTVDDNDGNTSNPATITIDYQEGPVASDDSPVASVGNPVTFDPLTNDSDSDGSLDPTTVQLIDPDTGNPLTSLTVPSEGTWSVDPTSGEITFTPDAGFTGDPTPITYTVDDNDGNTSNPATITIDYQEGPVASDDSPVASVGNPVTFDPLTNDSDSDGSLDPTTVQLIDPDTGNPLTSLTVPSEGTWSVDPTSGDITFTPDAGFTGDPTPVTYTVDDNDGNTSNPATITIDYQEGPVASDDSPVASVGNPITFDPLTNDSDSDGSLDPTTVQLIDPDTGNPLTSLTVPGEGTWSVDPTSGDITFTPDAGFTGDPTPVSYTVDDNDGNTSNPATITIDYQEGPAASDDSPVASVGNPVTFSPLTNDSDSDGSLDPTTVQLIDPDTGNPLTSLTVPGEGTWSVDPTSGEITFTPDAGFTGDPTPVTYTVADNDGNTSNPATITIDYRATKDSDKDGIPDVTDLDDDNDGILDTDEEQGDPNRDTDGDGIVDRLDLDSDNDGINDLTEAGHAAADPDQDGRVNGPFGANGFADLLETVPESDRPNYIPTDTDRDGVADFQDLDSDNDGINDVIEAGGSDPDGDGKIGTGSPADADKDGMADSLATAPLPVPDTDGDNVADYRDLDSDNDGLNDVREAGLTDADGDGQADGPDTDGDGIRDIVDQSPNTFGDSGSSAVVDTDGDNVADYKDLDSDDDGINDVVEAGFPDNNGDGVIDDGDTDGDGIKDAVDQSPNSFGDSGDRPPLDTDGDNVPDYKDLDSDNDGIKDIVEVGLPDPEGDGRLSGSDTDGDGIKDSVDTNSSGFGDINDPTATDTDGDRVADFRDLDSDNDGIPDVIEAGGSDPDQDGIIGSGIPSDIDSDGVTDSIDLDTGGTALPTPDQDGDGSPDYRDLDSDNDGETDLSESGANLPDANGDGVVDGPDTDGDGLVDLVDGDEGTFGSGAFSIQPPQDTDGDGIPDFRELPNPNASGTKGADNLTGTDSSDILNGFSDLDILDGGGGNDLINGGSSKDRLVGGEGNDVLNGGTNNDLMTAGLGDDVLNGGSGNDRMFGNDGNDILNGSQGKDKLIGRTAPGNVNPGGGRDRLFGGEDRDIIRGNAGNDLIVGGFGKDELTGGQGKDKFRYQDIKDFGDVITDFEIVKDRIDLRKIKSINSLGDLKFRQRGDDVLIRGDRGSGFGKLVTLEDVNADTLSDRHFKL
ncbi:MAG: DUF4347 domain-containing protein [Elainellaceae cyanobacterium]